MTTPDPQEDNSWRRHEVPTYTEAQDTFLFGLSFRQLIAIVIGCGVGYAVYQVLWFLGFWYRIGAGGVVVVLSAAFIALKPGGRSLFGVLFELISYQFRSKHYSDLVRHIISTGPIDQFRPQRKRKTLTIPIPTPSNTIYIRLRLPIGGRRGTAEVIALALLSSVVFGSFACFGPAEAQSPGHYIGKRVYLQSVVINYGGSTDEGGKAVTVRLKAAAPLRWAEPRVLESLQSPTERRAQGTTFEPAARYSSGLYVGGRSTILAIYGIASGEEFAFEDVLLNDTRQIRPYCDIPLETGHLRYYDGGDVYFFRHHSANCRIIQPLEFALNGADIRENGVSGEYSVSRPNMTVQWEDIRRNKGALGIGGPLIPWPAPTLYKMEQELIDTGAELLNPFVLCDPREIEVMSLGIQSEKPVDHGDEDYFEGRSGQVIAGEVKVCGLEKGDRMADVGLPETVVFAEGNTEFEIKVRPIVSTLLPENVDNRATLFVHALIGADDYFGNSAGYKVPKMGDSEFDATKPNVVKFVAPVPGGSIADKVNDGELDLTRFQFELVVDHIVTVKRPVYQPIQTFEEFGVPHIYQCRCSCSGGGCTSTCGSRSCNSNSNPRMRYFKYWDPHFRVDDEDRSYLPDDPSSDVMLHYTQTFTFEATYVSFDKPFVSLVYVEPTPRAGRLPEPDYYDEGGSLGYHGGFSTGSELVCGPDVGTVDGEPTGWVWVAPAVNSQGEAFGGCRKDYVCKLDVPPQEEVFGPGGIPTEEDYECVEYEFGD